MTGSSAVHAVELVGRGREWAIVDGLLERALRGVSGSLVVRADAGMGKTALLQAAATRAGAHMQALSVTGVETEYELSFAGLHGLVRPIIDHRAALPEPQRQALEAALGLAPPAASDRFLVSAGVLSLLAEAAEDGPILCVIDDAQWLDGPSIESLVFTARRLDAEGIVMLFAARESESGQFSAPGLPELWLDGLGRDAAHALLDTTARVASPRVRERLVADADGNPLALLELPVCLSEAQRNGLEALPDAIPLTARLRGVFREQVEDLGDDARRALVLAAAADGGELPVLVRAALRLGVEDDVFDEAERARLIEIRAGRLSFRHPLVRTAVYESATFAERRRAHAILAEEYRVPRQAEQRLWHRAMATYAADEELAAALEASAAQAQLRGGHASAATTLERAANLSETGESQGRRLAAGAHAAYVGGQVERAEDLAKRALRIVGADERPGLLGLRGLIEGFAGSLPGATDMLLEAVAESRDASLCLQLLLEAGAMTTYEGDVAKLRELCLRAAAIVPETDTDRFISVLLAAAAAELDDEPQRAEALSADALALADDLDDARCLIWISAHATRARGWGEGLAHADRAVRLARERALVSTLPYALQAQAYQLIGRSRFDLAYCSAEEGHRLALDLGQSWPASWCLADLATVDALYGDGEAVDARIAELEELVNTSSARLLSGRVARAVGMLDLGAGRPGEALDRLLSSVVAIRPESDPLFALGVPDAVEAAVRSQRVDEVRDHLAAFGGWVRRNANPARRSLLARCLALLDETAAEPHYLEAVDHADALSPFDRARTELLYGEWLRRQRRRVDARKYLRAALDRFEPLGVSPWVERARAELRASGETARRRDASTRDQLTPQELQIARLVATGRSNPEVAAQLFLSPRTIDYHLRKVFSKLEIASRTELTAIDLGEPAAA